MKLGSRLGSLIRSIVGIASLAAVAACGGGSSPASQMAKPPEFKPENQSKCGVTKSQARPLVVEWPSADRASLEAQTRRGLVAVRYEGCEMEVLRQCTVPGKYSYNPVTPKRDRVTMRDADELYANIPAYAAKFEAKLQKAGELNVKMTIVGTYEADRATVRKDELQGSCEGATHVVSALTTGAFQFFAGADAAAEGEMTVLGAGAGGKTSAKREMLNEDGNEAACEKVAAEDKQPPFGCGAVLRIEVVPVGDAKKPDPVCPTGTKWDGSQCAKQQLASADCPPERRRVGGDCAPPLAPPGATAAPGPPSKPPGPPPSSSGPNATTVYSVPITGSPWRGSVDALVTIVEFGDFESPFVVKADATLADIRKKYGSAVRVVWKSLPVVTVGNAEMALRAFHAADSLGKGWPMYDKLIANSRSLGRPELERFAKELGLDATRFKTALDKKETADIVAHDAALARRLGVVGVPAFFVNGRYLGGARSLDEYSKLIDEELGKAKAKVASGTAPGRIYEDIVKSGKPSVDK